MNKYVQLTIGFLMISNIAFSADCTGSNGGAGIDVVGVDGHHYCQSKIGMNWWSAFAWCEGIGKKLISLEDCNGADGTLELAGSSCPNFKGKGSNLVWTSSAPTGTVAYLIDLPSGSVRSDSGAATRTMSRQALCKD